MTSRARLLVAALVVLAAPTSVSGQDGTLDLSEGWQMLAAPDTAGRSDAWRDVSITATWADLRLMGYEGTVWFRRSLPADPAGLRDALAVGPARFGAYRVTVDGEEVGSFGSIERPLTYPVSRQFGIDPAQGNTELVVEFYRSLWGSDLAGDVLGPIEGAVMAGDSASLADRIELARHRRQMGDLLSLILAVLFVVAGAHHIEFYLCHRRQGLYLWFGVATFALAGNAIIYSSWIAEPLGSLTGAWRLNEALGHIATAALIQFLWEILDRPIGRWLRAYQASHVALAAALMVLPFPFLYDTTAFRYPWTWPLLVVAGWTLFREAYRGHPEARVLAVGGGVFLFAIVLDQFRAFGAALPPNLPQYGFLVVLVSMVVSLARRYSRSQTELETLREGLEHEVRRRTDQLEEAMSELTIANEAKSQFVANMSHELRTPLNSVLGFSDLLEQAPKASLGDLERHYAEQVRRGAEHLAELVNEVLDIAALEAGKLEVRVEEVDVAELVSGVLADQQPVVRDRPIQLYLDIEGDVEPVRTDPLRLKQVLVNLIGNAIKFTDAGSVTARVAAETGGVSVTVTDTGIGIAPEELDRVFEPFEQLTDGSNRGREGTGLGLAISSALCERLGARLEAESTPGQGSTFRIVLPFAQDAVDRAELPDPEDRPADAPAYEPTPPAPPSESETAS